MAKLVSKTYGDALFELALEEDKLDLLFEESKVIKEVFQSESEIRKLGEIIQSQIDVDKEEKKESHKKVCDINHKPFL